LLVFWQGDLTQGELVVEPLDREAGVLAQRFENFVTARGFLAIPTRLHPRKQNPLPKAISVVQQLGFVVKYAD